MPSKLLNLEWLQVFQVVCQTQQMNQAAKVLGLTPPAISQAIQKLENLLQAELFYHDRRPMALTAAGRRLLEDGLPLLDGAQKLVDRFVSNQSNMQCLRLGLTDSLLSTVSRWLIDEIQARFADVHIDSGKNAGFSEKLSNASLDICVYSEEKAIRADWIRIPVYEERYLAITRKNIDHFSSPEQLKLFVETHPLICYHTDTSIQQQIDRYLDAMNLKPNRRVQVLSCGAQVELIEALHGWALMPPMGLLGGGESLCRLSFRQLQGKFLPTRRIWVVGRQEFEKEVQWIAEILRNIIETQALPTMAAKISPLLSDNLILLPDSSRKEGGCA